MVYKREFPRFVRGAIWLARSWWKKLVEMETIKCTIIQFKEVFCTMHGEKCSIKNYYVLL